MLRMIKYYRLTYENIWKDELVNSMIYLVKMIVIDFNEGRHLYTFQFLMKLCLSMCV